MFQAWDLATGVRRVKARIFVPIKEESVRVPGKNFRKLRSHELWWERLQEYKKTELPVFINTDSGEIVSRIGFGDQQVLVIERRTELCEATISMNAIIKDFLENYVEDPDEIICQVHVTNPFLKAETILNAIRTLYLSSVEDSVIGATFIQARCWLSQDLRKVSVNHNPLCLQGTEYLSPIMIENSCFYVFTKRSFMKTNNRIGHSSRFLPVSFPENVDIDTEDDWEMCKQLVKVYG